MFYLLRLCQAPRDRRRASSLGKHTDLSAVGSSNYGSLEILDHHLQALRSMPVNLSLNNTTAAQRQGSKYGATNVPEDIREGDGKAGAGAGGGGAVALVKTEGQTPMAASCSGSYVEEPSRDQTKMPYEQSCYDLSLSRYLKNEQRGTPDSVQEDAAEREVRDLELALGLVFPK